ncbi:RA_Radil_like and Myo5p-like_CBD_Rasip1 domain-containing protein [Alosa sapidissima]|uniref:RA_Radil_like and Myo5p-like_CBD_Rasip1 domain-containing protein n=1 Tax=Alosa sapidissima TaxID=34773 RepID=UPI001C09B811|nr:RA_Radil_like and Myo5p-like_CBD_Rasip1 domain-containing protein [Alosa sapidissima]
MISEERSNHIAKQALGFPVGLLIRSPKRRLAKLGRKSSNGSLQSNTSDSTTRSVESSTGVRQPAKSKIRRHNNRLSTVFNRSPLLRDGGSRSLGGVGDRSDPHPVADDPAELSSQMSAPGILKIFGSDICQGANYKSVLATSRSSAKELIKEALERYSLEKEDSSDYVLCDVIGQTGADHQWKTECYRVVGEHERPLMLQALWKPKQGLSRRFEIQKRSAVEERSARDTDDVTAGLNAQARKLQHGRSRVTSLFVDGSEGEADGQAIWRSLSDMDVSAMGQEAGRAARRALGGQKDPTVAAAVSPPESPSEADARSLRTEKEETESSDDNSTQYSVHPPFDFPYFLLLQGYNYRQDFVIYLMSGSSCVLGCCGEHLQGEDEERLKVDVLLFAPDVLPQHCRVRRQDPDVSESHGGGGGHAGLTLLEPFQGAAVTHNGVPLKHETPLSPGDLVGLGQHYLFMFKDPTAGDAPRTPAWITWLCPGSEASDWPGKAGRAFGGIGGGRRRFGRPILRWRDLEGRELCLAYALPQEDRLLDEILAAVEPVGDTPKLTPAFLLCLCVQHSAAHFKMADLRRLLLRIASQIQLTMWERTKELAVIQPDRRSSVGLEEPDEVRPLGMTQLVPGLQPLVLWMANSIELLHFIQHEVPLLLPWGQTTVQQRDGEEHTEDELDSQHGTGLSDSQILSTRTASEEAMTVLEEVIMFTFQQCVYYLTKSMYAALPGLLDSNPFSESGALRVPAGVSAVLEVLQGALQLLQAFQVHGQISSQLLAYLFFFTNASLFNTLMERGSGGGFYQWSRGVQIRANLDLLMDWIQGIGLGDLAAEFFQKLSSAVNLLATPKENLLQASWTSLRAEFLHLNPAQLHHMLREYNPGRSCPSSWSPTPDDAEAALRTSDILESFDNHPPLILPSHSFHLELGKPVVDQGLFRQLERMQEFLRTLPVDDTPVSSQTADGHQSLTSPSVTASQTSIPSSPSSWSEAHRRALSRGTLDSQTRGSHSDLSSCEAGLLTQKLKSLELQSSLPGEAGLGIHKSLALDPSCLLTPPNTPQNMEQAELEASLQEGAQHNNASHRKGAGDQQKGSREEEEDEEDREEVFTVELTRGPHGLGLALVDGMKTPLKIKGIFIKSVVPDSPAARCQKLRLGDRILAVNGVSLVGMDYHTGRELIRTSGNSLRLLVAKTEARSSGRSAMAKC